MLYRKIIGVTVCLCAITTALSAEWDQVLFYTDGKRVDLGDVDNEAGIVAVHPRWESICESGQEVCIAWELVWSDEESQDSVLARVQAGIGLWDSEEEIAVNFSYEGTKADNSWPYVLQEGESVMHSSGHPLLEGPVRIYLEPPEDFEFPDGVVSQSFRLIDPNLEQKSGKIDWAGIFINPDYNPLLGCEEDCFSVEGNGSFSLRSLIAHEMGRVMGLAPSTLKSSVMYPLKDTQNLPVALHSSDILWASSLYPKESSIGEFGSIEGRLLDGQSAQALSGASVYAIPQSSVGAFSDSGELSQVEVTAATLVRQEGWFDFVMLPPGSYVLFVRSLNEELVSSQHLDEWMQIFSDSKSFDKEFYDGEGRESNWELSGYSPRSIGYAAFVHVEKDETTKNVQFITNLYTGNSSKWNAEGSTNETLSSDEFGDLTGLLKAGFDKDQKSEVSGGCWVSISPVSSQRMIYAILSLFFVLILVIRQQVALKEG